MHLFSTCAKTGHFYATEGAAPMYNIEVDDDDNTMQHAQLRSRNAKRGPAASGDKFLFRRNVGNSKVFLIFTHRK